MGKIIYAPFSPLEVDKLNTYQRLGYVHEFTCPHDHGHGLIDRTLVATVNGWICPHCDYAQNWAHEMMLTPPPNPLIAMKQQMFETRLRRTLDMFSSPTIGRGDVHGGVSGIVIYEDQWPFIFEALKKAQRPVT